MGFKETLQYDKKVFLNIGEMASTYDIDGTKVDGVYTQDKFLKDEKNMTEGVFIQRGRFTCDRDVLPRLPVIGETWRIDGVDHTIADGWDRMGLYTVELIRYIGR